MAYCYDARIERLTVVETETFLRQAAVIWSDEEQRQVWGFGIIHYPYGAAMTGGETGVGDGGGKVPTPSRMLAAIEAITISAEDAKIWVGKLRSASDRRHPEDDTRRQQDRIADQIIARYSKITAIAAGAAALPGVIPGVGSLLAFLGGGSIDLALSLKLQVDMCRCFGGLLWS